MASEDIQKKLQQLPIEVLEFLLGALKEKEKKQNESQTSTQPT